MIFLRLIAAPFWVIYILLCLLFLVFGTTVYWIATGNDASVYALWPEW